MLIIADILNELSKSTLYYKGVPVNIFGLPKLKTYKAATVRMTINRLKRKNLIAQEMNSFMLTSAGKNYLERRHNSLTQFTFAFSKNAPKNLLVMFDIPEAQKAEREWFRFQLKKAGFVMLQKSVWVGPSPLPKAFMDYVKKIKLDKNIKTLRLAKPQFKK